MQHQKPTILASLVVAAFFLAGCQPSQPSAPEAASAPTEPTAATAQPALAAGADATSAFDRAAGLSKRDATPVDTTIDAVVLSNEGDTERATLGSPATRFGPTDPVYAEITSSGTATEYTIYAKWIDAEGNVLADYGVRVNEAGPTRTVISLSKPDGWAVGRNRIELAINGKTQRTVGFDVQ